MSPPKRKPRIIGPAPPPGRSSRPRHKAPGPRDERATPETAPGTGTQPILLYLHVPFCRSKCSYCAFHSRELDMTALNRWADTVVREMRHWGRRLNRPPVRTVYIGGGTPSLVPIWTLEPVLKALRDHFELLPDLEFTFEANPESVDAPLLDLLLARGVNRLSLGFQSLDKEDLALLGRPHGPAQAVGAFHAARHAGFRNISVDLIWGLPGRRLRHWLSTLKRVVELRPDHVSCYNLTVEPGTPLEARLLSQGPELPPELPADEEQARMFLQGATLLESEGYFQYEVSNFARMGFFSRHNAGYWNGEDYLGLGPSAVSTLAGKRFENPRDQEAWEIAVDAGTTDARAEEITPELRVREMVMLAFRTSNGLSVAAYRKLTGRDFLKEHERLLTVLRQKGLVRLTKGRVALTKTGMLVADAIVQRFVG